MLPQDEVRLVSCLIFSIPISYLMTYINKSSYLLIYTCLCSITFQLIVFRQWIVLLWIQQHIVYMICRYGSRIKIGKYVFIETFIVLTGIQATRMYFSYGIQCVDITAIFMMQVFQYVSFAYNYQDGLLKNQKQSIYVIKQFPSYFEYLGYVHFVPSCLVGPVFEFNDYLSYLYKQGVFQNVKPGFSVPGIKKQLKTTFFCTGMFVATLAFPIQFILTQKFAQYNFIFQSLYVLVSLMGVRFKYYLAWSLGMIGMNASGLTSNPKVEKEGKIVNKWDRVVVSNIWDFQMEPSMKKKVDGWNISIQVALKRYIYDRINKVTEGQSPKERKKMQIEAQQKTIAVTAIWHGLYIGYFLAFFHWTLMVQISQELFRIEKESAVLKKWRNKLKYLETFIINYFVDYVAVSFVMLTWDKIQVFFSVTYCIPLVVLYIANLLIVQLAVFSKKTLKNKKGQQLADNHSADKTK